VVQERAANGRQPFGSVRVRMLAAAAFRGSCSSLPAYWWGVKTGKISREKAQDAQNRAAMFCGFCAL